MTNPSDSSEALGFLSTDGQSVWLRAYDRETGDCSGVWAFGSDRIDVSADGTVEMTNSAGYRVRIDRDGISIKRSAERTIFQGPIDYIAGRDIVDLSRTIVSLGGCSGYIVRAGNQCDDEADYVVSAEHCKQMNSVSGISQTEFSPALQRWLPSPIRGALTEQANARFLGLRFDGSNCEDTKIARITRTNFSGIHRFPLADRLPRPGAPVRLRGIQGRVWQRELECIYAGSGIGLRSVSRPN